MSIADRIKSLRELHGLTQSQLAIICNVSDKAVSTWENGRNVPRMGAIQKMADYFNVSKGTIVDEDPIVQSINELKEKFIDQYTCAISDGMDSKEFIEIKFYQEAIVCLINGNAYDFSTVFFKLDDQGRKDIILNMLKRYC